MVGSEYPLAFIKDIWSIPFLPRCLWDSSVVCSALLVVGPLVLTSCLSGGCIFTWILAGGLHASLAVFSALRCKFANAQRAHPQLPLIPRNGFVAANSVMHLRQQLTEKGQCSSFATSEKGNVLSADVLYQSGLSYLPLFPVRQPCKLVSCLPPEHLFLNKRSATWRIPQTCQLRFGHAGEFPKYDGKIGIARSLLAGLLLRRNHHQSRICPRGVSV